MTRQPPVSYEEKRIQSLCPLPLGWRIASLVRSGNDPWRIEEDPVLALAVVRTVELATDLNSRYEKDTELDRPYHVVEGISAESLAGYYEGSGSQLADALYEDGVPYLFDAHWKLDPATRYVAIFLGYVPPGERIRDGDKYVRAAERLVEEYERRNAEVGS